MRQLIVTLVAAMALAMAAGARTNENDPMFKGPYLKAMVLRAQRTGAAEDREKCRKLAEELLPREEQVVPWFYGLDGYSKSGFIDETMKKRVADRMLAVGLALEKNGWKFPFPDSSPSKLFILHALWDATRDWSWGVKYNAATFEPQPGTDLKRIEVCERGCPADGDAELQRIRACQVAMLAELAQRECRYDVGARYRKGVERSEDAVRRFLAEPLADELVRSGEVRTNELTTAWGRKVTPANAWREYPRPQLVRKGWTSLNGEWDLVIRNIEYELQPTNFTAKILVPFPVESPLSGVHRKVLPTEELVYRRTFEVVKRGGERTLLNFESVDWRAQVYVNGVEAGVPHEGGSVPFSYDVTDLVRAGENALEVRVWDPTDTFIGSTGKQTLALRTCFFPASSGICGSVWTEQVAETYLASYAATPDASAGTVSVMPKVVGNLSGAKVTVEALWDGRVVASGAQARCDRPVVLKLPQPVRLWSPDDPALYGLRLTVAADGRADVAEGYFAVRTLSLVKDAKGIARTALNGKPIYLLGALDQGYWPDGYVTPPSEAACRWDVDYMKSIGMNVIRKHIKIEPRAFYAHCDRVGMMVMQDLPSAWCDHLQSAVAETTRRYGFHRREAKEIVDHLGNHPSVVCWIAYNEGWGQPNAEMSLDMGRWLKRYDPTRLLNLASGWCHFEDGWRNAWTFDAQAKRPEAEYVTDILDDHEYPGPKIERPNPHRAVICGEFGGIGSCIDGHCTDIRGKAHKYVAADDPTWRERCRKRYREFVEKQKKLAAEGSSGSILCEDLDCFWEHGGFVTFDRAVERLDRDFLRTCHKEIYDAAAADRTAWHREAKFGLFIHWGIYAMSPADGEWAWTKKGWKPGEYEARAKAFNPTAYDPGEWARLAKAAGMRYVVFTTRHHDGFCMFDSHFTDYKVTKSPYGRDVTRMLVEAFRKEGLKVGFYHSLPDWGNRGYADPETPEVIRGGRQHVPTAGEYAGFTNLVYNHVHQLMTEYGKIDLLFLDYTSKHKEHVDYFGRDRLLEMIRTCQPDIIVNDRLAYWKHDPSLFDYYTPEICVPNQPQTVLGREVPWETCATMNDHWGFADGDANFKSVESLVAGLVGCVSQSGNLLLNVGPDALGRFPQGSVDALKGLAAWYRVNGESVAGCGRSAYRPPFGCAYTQKGNVLYCHFLQVPLGDVILPQLRGSIERMTLLRTGEAVKQVNEWGFELLARDEQRIRTRGIRVGDVVKIELAPEPNVTARVQREIDAAFRAGGGTVEIPSGAWSMGAVRLRSDVTLLLRAGATVRASRNPENYDILSNDAVEPPVAEDLLAASPSDADHPANRALIRVLRAANAKVIGEPGSAILRAEGCPPAFSSLLSTNAVFRGIQEVRLK